MAEAPTRYFRQRLNSDPEAIGHMRRIAAAFLRNWRWDHVVDPAVLCVTELLSNARQHTVSGNCVLLMQASASCVRITVSDNSEALPVVCEPDWLTERGRGMFLLSKSVDAWGANLTPQGKDVWIEFWGRETAGPRDAVAGTTQPRWTA
ncbi:ATP-binding protein [Streptomyces sp. NPDC093707]|uniref:ATP-binding protein n=1 Tax=Streptomyces sp. NPDC093707 TaxID=3154984 RepID=UPI00344D4386